MNITNRVLVLAVAGLALSVFATARQQMIVNGSVELGPGPGGVDFFKVADWQFVDDEDRFSIYRDYGGVFNFEPAGGIASVRIQGSDDLNETLAYQDVAVSAGEQIAVNAHALVPNDTPLDSSTEGLLRLEFFDAGDLPIGAPIEVVALDDASMTDVWIPASIGPVAAPSGAAYARVTISRNYSGDGEGVVYFDGCEMTIDGGANVLLNGDFEQPGTSDETPFGIDFWFGFGEQEKSGDFAFDGIASVRVESGNATGSSYSGIYQDMLDLFAGDHVYLRGFIYNPSVGGLQNDALAGIKLEFQPVDGITPPPPEENLALDQSEDRVDEWFEISYTTTVPEDMTLARIVIVSFDESTDTGPVYVDNAVATLNGGPNLLLNPSFEDGPGGVNGIAEWNEFRGIFCSARKTAFEVPVHPDSEGLNFAKISGSCTAGLTQEVVVAPGDELTIAAQFYQRGDEPFAINPDDPWAAGVKVEWVAGQIPEWVDIGQNTTNTLESDAPTDTWTEVYVDYLMPAGSAARTRATFINGNYGSPGVVSYFDSMEAVVLNRFDGADSDGDFDQDMVDVWNLQPRFTGADNPPLPYLGLVFDFDDDDDIDGSDVSYFLPRMTGPATD